MKRIDTAKAWGLESRNRELRTLVFIYRPRRVPFGDRTMRVRILRECDYRRRERLLKEAEVIIRRALCHSVGQNRIDFLCAAEEWLVKAARKGVK